MPYLTTYLLLLLGTTILSAQTQLQIAVVADRGPQADYAQSLLETELQQSGQFALVEREKIAETIKELAFQISASPTRPMPWPSANTSTSTRFSTRRPTASAANTP